MIPVLFVATAILQTGCGEQEEITSYKVPKPSVELPDPTHEMLGAIVPAGDQIWFFKSTVPLEIADEADRRFDTLIRTVTFANSRPEWILPEGWEQLPDDHPKNTGIFPRFATLVCTIDNEPMELGVTRLERPSDDELDQFLLLNVNRWRKQMGLGELARLEEDQEMQAVPIDGNTASIIKLKGTQSDTGMGRAPFASGGMPKPPSGTQSPPRSEPAELSYTRPEGWSPGRMSFMRKAAFEVTEGNQRVEITVINAGGGLLANVNRWREQIQLKPTTPEELKREIQTIEVDGTESPYLEMVGPESAEPRLATLVVIANAGGKIWFVKLSGHSQLAEKEKANFEQFVRSIRFSNPDGSR